MKILSLGLDNSILKKNSQLRERVFDYADLVDKYFVVVPNKKYSKEDLNNKLSIFGSGGINKIIQLFKIYFLGKKLIKENRFDIITVQDQYYLALIGWWLAKKYSIALEIQVHGFEKFAVLRKLIAKFVIKKADGVRVVSNRLKEKLVNEFGVSDEKILVIPIYTKLSTINYQLPTKKNKFIFLTVSRFVRVKNIEMQIKVMKEVVKKHANVELWILGKGSLRKNYEFRIKDLKLDKNVKILDWVDDEKELHKIYVQANCFLLTSNSEGWGLAVIDAASQSLPIIMTDVGLAGEVIKNNESGLVIPVGDEKVLKDAMVRIIGDKGLREKLGENARFAVESLPSKKETLELYLEAWNNAIYNANASN